MKKIIILLLLLSNIASAQHRKTSWKLYLGKKVAMKGVAGSPKEYTFSNVKGTVLKLKCYPNISLKNWINTLIIMDTNRVEIIRKIITVKDNSVVIKNEYLDSHKKITAYIYSVPSDPKLAAKIRVGTNPLVTIKLLN
jgi:hypothetical protein